VFDMPKKYNKSGKHGNKPVRTGNAPTMNGMQ
jgi:hypothetical protein